MDSKTKNAFLTELTFLSSLHRVDLDVPSRSSGSFTSIDAFSLTVVQ